MSRTVENAALAAAAVVGAALLVRYRKADGTEGTLGDDIAELVVTARRLPMPAPGGDAPTAAKGPPVRSGPRGIRNNNPGNIDWIASPAQRWRGMIRKETAADVPPGVTPRFGVFDTPANGVRAIGKELQRSAERGARTVRDLIAGIPQRDGSRFDAWAPPHENDTGAYVATVARALGVSPDGPLDIRNRLPQLAAAIIRHEQGVQPYTERELAQWVYLA